MPAARFRPLLLLPVVLMAAAIVSLARRPPFAEAPLDYLFDALTGVVLVAAGLVAWARRPSARTGPLIVLAGYLWYVGSLYVVLPDHVTDGLVARIPFLGFVLRGYYDPILAFVILSFPGRRLETRRDRLAVGALVALMVAHSLWRLVGVRPGIGPGNPPDAPANPFLVITNIGTFVAGDQVLTALVGVALVVVAAVMLARRRRIRPGARRATDPVLIGGAIWAGLAGLYDIGSWTHEILRLDIVPWDGPGWTAQYLLRLLGPLGLLVGALRIRGSSAAAIALMAGPDGPPRGIDMERTLRRTLDDPGLRLLTFSPGSGWLDSSGRPVSLPGLDAERSTTLLERDGTPTGAIVHDVTLLDDPALVRTVAAAVALAMDNERLQEDLQTQLEEVRASRARIVEAGDLERRRVERDLHDGAQQRLVALAVSLRTIRSRLGPDVAAPVTSELDAAGDLVKAAIAEVRELARGLDPSILREAGLGAAVQSLADHSAIPVRVSIDLDGRLPARAETAAYFVAAEALANAAKHSDASAVTVTASQAGGTLSMEVADDGGGGADLDGSGIRGLADRIAAVGGTFAVESPLGAGTRIRVSIPCAS
jgi:signal transduction histidine kinase